MHPTRLKALQAEAAAATAESVAGIDARLAALEAKLDEALALLKAQAVDAAPKPPRKEK